MIHIHFVNIDTSLVMKLTFLKLAIHVAEIQCKGRLSQNFDIDLSYGFILCGIVDSQNDYKKIQKFPVFHTKI